MVELEDIEKEKTDLNTLLNKATKKHSNKVGLVQGNKLKTDGSKELTKEISEQIIEDLDLTGRGLAGVDEVVTEETTVPKAKELPQDDVGHDMDIDDLSNICDEIIKKSKVAVRSFKEGNKDTLVNKVIKATKSEIVNPLVVTVLLNNKLQDTTQEDITNG